MTHKNSRTVRRIQVCSLGLLLLAFLGGAFQAARADQIPAQPDPARRSIRFAVIGDWGDGSSRERNIAAGIANAHKSKPLDLILTAGDNIYPSGAPRDFVKKFEQPFAEVIKAGVPFYACLGNHDVRSGARAQTSYPLFHMGGNRYYSCSFSNDLVEVFVLDSNDMTAEQMQWFESALARSKAVWKVAVFHHPLYSSGKLHGSDTGLRKKLEPILVRGGVRVVFSGHDHVYQRVTMQHGIQYFVTGGGGKLRDGGLDRKDPLVAAGYDEDSHFMLVEATPSEFRFQAVSATGSVVDSGTIAH